jgi:hypothetical protein
MGGATMRENQSLEVRHNGIPRTYPDRRAIAFEAACYIKSRNPVDITRLLIYRLAQKSSCLPMAAPAKARLT